MITKHSGYQLRKNLNILLVLVASYRYTGVQIYVEH